MVIVHPFLPVEGYVGWCVAGVWLALGVASGLTCISSGGPSMHYRAQWGKVLKVERHTC